MTDTHRFTESNMSLLCLSSRRDREETSDQHQIRDPLFYRFRYPSTISQDCGKEWLSGFALGKIHYTKWR